MVIKIVELIGISTDGFEAAIQEAVTRTGKTIKNISGVDVIGQSVKVAENQLTEYRVNVKLAFRVE